MPTDPVRFEAPDVRKRKTVDTVENDPSTPWLGLTPGVAYEGLCSNSRCNIQSVSVMTGLPPAMTMCNMGFGKFRPNEDLHYKHIICPACQAPFVATRFFFQHCSAKINYCIAGDNPSVTTLSEDRVYKSRVFGQRGVHVVYSMLVIEVEEPNAFPEGDELDLFSYNEIQSVDLWAPNMYNSLLHFMCPNWKKYMNPADIFYTQDSISSKFQCGKLVKRTMELLASRSLDILEIPLIRVFLWDGRWHSQDNRRLWAFKTAGLTSVPVQVVQKESVKSSKLTTENRGASIRMRGAC
eukprot:symbB.v1.2.027012.t1/scaffold2631.1/size74421/7